MRGQVPTFHLKFRMDGERAPTAQLFLSVVWGTQIEEVRDTNGRLLGSFESCLHLCCRVDHLDVYDRLGIRVAFILPQKMMLNIFELCKVFTAHRHADLPLN
jgi:hypothetical protein